MTSSPAQHQQVTEEELVLTIDQVPVVTHHLPKIQSQRSRSVRSGPPAPRPEWTPDREYSTVTDAKLVLGCRSTGPVYERRVGTSHLSEQFVQLTNDVRGCGLSKQTGLNHVGTV